MQRLIYYSMACSDLTYSLCCYGYHDILNTAFYRRKESHRVFGTKLFFNHGNLQIWKNDQISVSCCKYHGMLLTDNTPFSRMGNGTSELYLSHLKMRERKKEVFILYRDNVANRKK